MIIKKIITIRFGDGNRLYMADVRTVVIPAFVGAFAVIKEGTKNSFVKSQAIILPCMKSRKQHTFSIKEIKLKLIIITKTNNNNHFKKI